jgi:hypothetical protein
MGVRPTPAKTVPLVTPSPKPSNKAPTFPTHLKKLFSAPTQMARVSMDSWTEEQKDLYRSKTCFHCKQPGHVAKNCKSRPLPNDFTVPPAPTDLGKLPNPPPPEPSLDLKQSNLSESEFRYEDQTKHVVTAPTVTSCLVSTDTIQYLNKLTTSVISPRLLPNHVRLMKTDLVDLSFCPARTFSQDNKRNQELMHQQLENDGMEPFSIRFQRYRKAATLSRTSQLHSLNQLFPSFIEPGSSIPVKVDQSQRFNIPVQVANNIPTDCLADTGSQGMFMGYDRASEKLTFPDREILSFEKVMLSCQVQSWVGIEPTTSHDEGRSC